jgi:hypothetical protein
MTLMKLAIIVEIIETQDTYGQLVRQNYFENVLFSYQWWFLLVITAGLWITWIFIVDRTRLNAVLLVGLVTGVFALTADEIGLLTSLWTYSHSLLPTTKLYSVDLAIVPVSFMLLYQYARKWKTYVIVLAILALFAVIVAEPLFVLLDIYTLLTWEHWYGFPIYILMGIVVKWVVDKLAEGKG